MSTMGSCLRGKKETYNNDKITKLKFFFSVYLCKIFCDKYYEGKKLSEAPCWRFARRKEL